MTVQACLRAVVVHRQSREERSITFASALPPLGLAGLPRPSSPSPSAAHLLRPPHLNLNKVQALLEDFPLEEQAQEEQQTRVAQRRQEAQQELLRSPLVVQVHRSLSSNNSSSLPAHSRLVDPRTHRLNSREPVRPCLEVAHRLLLSLVGSPLGKAVRNPSPIPARAGEDCLGRRNLQLLLPTPV